MFVEVGAAVVFVECAFEPGVVAFERHHGVVHILADARQLGVGLELRPAGVHRHPEDIGGEVFVFVLGIGPGEVAQEKEQKVAELAQPAAEVCGSTVAYAEQSGDVRLAAKLNIPFTKLSTGKDSRIISNCRNIYKAASSVVDSLGEFKVTAAKLKSLKQKTDDYKSLSTKPREAAAERKAATKSIPVVLRQATRLLGRRLDPLLVPFKASNPEFYAQYKAARRIVKPGSADGAKAA